MSRFYAEGKNASRVGSFSTGLRATLTLSGTIIGLGTFAIPWSFAQAGFWAGVLELVVLTLVVIYLHLIYGEIVLRTPGVKTRFVGYVGLYLGSKIARLASLIFLISLWSVLLVYIVVGGLFLSKLQPLLSINEHVGPLIFLFLGLGGVLLGLRGTSRLEAWSTLGLVALALLIVGALMPDFRAANITVFNLSSLFVPYGIILFALDGAAAIPELEEILGKAKRGLLGRVIVVGTLLPAILYLFFAFGIVGALGASVFKDAISGLGTILPVRFLWLAYAFGFLAILTTFWIVGIYLWQTLENDLRFNKRLAFAASFLPPLLFYAVGLRDFIAIVSLIGAVFFPFNAVLLLEAHHRSKKLGQDVSSYSLPNPRFLRFLLAVIFLSGLIYEFWHFLV